MRADSPYITHPTLADYIATPGKLFDWSAVALWQQEQARDVLAEAAKAPRAFRAGRPGPDRPPALKGFPGAPDQ